MKTLLFILAVASTYFSLFAQGPFQEKPPENTHFLSEIALYSDVNTPILGVAEMLKQKAPSLNQDVINKVTTALHCAHKFQINHNHILTIIDYSLPSNEKRLWVFDLRSKALLFNTYVSHGINSGARYTNNFSNKNNSKASSMGIYATNDIYFGRDGLSLRLDGLERGFNDNANARYVVMHGGWYVNEPFIKKYGRAGRSWGCPALPLTVSKEVINTIKDKSFFVVYYPSDDWFINSRFLNCGHFSPIPSKPESKGGFLITEESGREPILFADLNRNNRHEENEPVLTITADKYQQFFKKNPPLERMLRRQIKDEEYIVLTVPELKSLIQNPIVENKEKQAIFYPVYSALKQDKQPNYSLNGEPQNTGKESAFDYIHFVIPVIKGDRGYFKTEMHILPYGKIKTIASEQGPNFTVVFNSKSFILKTTNEFIRWLGL